MIRKLLSRIFGRREPTETTLEPDAGGASMPRFKYHPDPISTGAIQPSGEACPCCGLRRGFLYTGPVYCTKSIEGMCPWCIASGLAARKFEAEFVDGHHLARDGLDEQIIREVTERTPGYASWQGDAWISCCGDACEFHGEPSGADLTALSDAEVADMHERTGFDEEHIRLVARDYEAGQSPSLYKFICRVCQRTRYGMDCD